ncbi:hypothetical protein VNO80_19638 [Phaseolus coccineus]|uniref:Uncharacterized protein n=1 Tax=Phaseolus coccineus TaxID=3886 RepID=A0AAN9MGI2_PHACN
MRRSKEWPAKWTVLIDGLVDPTMEATPGTDKNKKHKITNQKAFREKRKRRKEKPIAQTMMIRYRVVK